MNPNEKSFMDRGTILTVVLTLILWFAWSKYTEWKYPPAPAQAAQAGKEAAPAAATNTSGSQPAQLGADSKNATSQANQPVVDQASAASPEQVVEYSDEFLSFQISSRGMGIREVVVKKYKSRSGGVITIGNLQQNLPFSTSLADAASPLDFKIEKSATDTFVGTAMAGGLKIEKMMKVVPGSYTVETTINVTGQMDGFKGIKTTIADKIIPHATGGFLTGSAPPETQEWFARHDGKKTRVTLNPKENLQVSELNTSAAALSSHYFTLALLDRSDLTPKFEASHPVGAEITSGNLVYQPVSKVDKFAVKYVAFAGPKEFELLSRVDDGFSQIIDYGMFGILGKPILWLLKYLYSVIGNWGFAIIVLTIVVRALVMPFNAYSYKSMKAMQKVQPEMARIREKYKDGNNEARLQMNQEIMKLMKENNASPLGGCLPMLLQLPVFFALYQVLGQSIELYQAPFVFWIKDLSVSDHFYVLPILMGITMFINQKITPTTMDPQQAKIMQWMPVLFTFFMVNLPSGLTLYIFISTLFGIVQQYFFMRDRNGPVNRKGQVKEARA